MNTDGGRPSVSVVIPVYNSEPSLPLLTQKLIDVFRTRPEPFEIVFVDDDSADQSWRVVRQLADAHQNIRGIRLLRNYGQHNALLCGIRGASHHIIITMDDDLQNPPEEIPRLLDALTEQVDVVYGTPIEGAHGIWRNLASGTTKFVLSSAMGAKTASKVSTFRAFRRDVIDAFGYYRSPWVSIDVLLTWGTSRFQSILVRHDRRAIGQSNYTFGKLLRHALNMLTGFSVMPLQAASILGFCFAAFGIIVLGVVVGRYLIQGVTVPGFAFLASIITIFAGVQMFAIGVIGEYLARMYYRTMDRPSYAVRERSGNWEDEERSHKDPPTLQR